jgi:glycosyltransferase involved in cell wall biosynthesis
VRIAVVTHKFTRNDGQGRVNYEVAHGLLDAGHQLVLIGSAFAQTLIDHPSVEVIAISVSRWPTELIRNQIFAVLSAIALKRSQVDLIIVNGFITWHSSDINAVHFVHGAWLESPAHDSRQAGWSLNSIYQRLYTALNSRLELYAFRRTQKIIAVSSKVQRELIDRGVPELMIEVIPNGVDTEEFVPGQEQRSSLGLPEHSALALFAGDIKTYRKNLDSVLRALVLAPGVHLVVAGGIEGSPFPKMTIELGISERVQFLGHRTDLPRLMRAVDFFVFPSRFEAMSLVVLEALASGLPVITTHESGTEGIVTSECGYMLTSPEDINRLAEAIYVLATNPQIRERMARASRKISETLDWAVVRSNYVKIIKDFKAPVNSQ